MVLWTALGVGGATVIGAVIGFVFRETSHKFSDIVLAFAAGVMLAAAVLGLILPSVEYRVMFSLIRSPPFPACPPRRIHPAGRRCRSSPYPRTK